MTHFDETSEPPIGDEPPIGLSWAGLTKEKRATIIADYTARHDGRYDPSGFFDEVQEDPNHPARSWFVWDLEQGWLEANLERAGAFARGLTIERRQKVVDHGVVSITVSRIPLLHSPMADRSIGGGYIFTDPNNDRHMANLCQEGAATLTAWINRYHAAVKHCGGSMMIFHRQIRLLEKMIDDKAA